MTNDTAAPAIADVPVFNWREIRLVSHPLNLTMLEPDGYRHIKVCHLLNESTHTEPQQARIVVFDEEYVRQVIAGLIVPLVFDAIESNRLTEFRHRIALLVGDVTASLEDTFLNALAEGQKLTKKECLKSYKNS
ncbi:MULTISPECIES: hypothetical protein [unclassified Microcoleus]|uniref:hypothetical protein n=3 Tax=Microcoleus TaxID=44471 RepID=UPI001DB37D43|nr:MULTISPECIES: hypothetical protein [unclassified Microcoleus]MCC3422230.1 hypothetical protein [Microcoleus sp. PH2017_07_MST_O_A]MCC3445781.1 hypothetical protein [Microcoleus sp. PH2017_03_ELD_O_A]MCC3506548.1 hypothetical protein [Microcoleus sp. PH2017_19_SFW_U_A]MCC3439407.1 hypothetical protein [Microcoleus sp. PH2017_05_CCC_O_A]MCC3526106.1 hypothetical protein [Microcoleus sp. PH2017_20_SFW_D_A]